MIIIQLSLMQHQRLSRANTQKIYIVGNIINGSSINFSVVGATGNIYTVTLEGKPRCTCPDNVISHKRCKHIYFMLAKIFNIDNPEQPTFTQDEIKHYVDTYKNVMNQYTQEYKNINKCATINLDDDDECAICLENVKNGEKYIYCKQTCGKCIHMNCYSMIKSRTSNCPYCMSHFVASEILI